MSKKISHLSRADHIQLHQQVLQPMCHAYELLKYQSERESVIYAQLDFHILMPHLFPTAGNGSKPILPNIRQWLTSVLKSQEELGMSFYLTGPTFLEFLDQLKHHAETVQDVLTKQIDRIEKELEPIDEHSFSSSEQIQTWLSALTEDGFDRCILRPVQELSSLIDQGLVRGIGDISYVPDKQTFKKYQPVINSLFKNQCAERLKFDQRKRPDADSRFHYKIDAANMGISKIMQTEADCDLLMFTRTQFTIREMSNLARSDQSLPALLNLSKLDETHIDRLTRLKDAIRFAQENVNRMKTYASVVDFPKNLCERLLTFYNETRPRLFPTERESENDAQHSGLSYEEARAMLSDKRKLYDGMERAVSGIEDGASSIAAKLSSIVRLDLWEDFRLDDDPVYQKLRKDLRF